MNKNYGKHIVVIELIKTHDAGILLANGGGLRPLQPPLFFLRRTRPLQVSSCRELDVVFESGGVAPPPPNPPLSFQAVQACFQEHGTIKKNCVRHMLASSFLPAKTEPIRACDKDLVFASGKGCASNTIVIQEFFKAQSTGLLLANGAHGAPAFLRAVHDRFKYHPTSRNRTHQDPSKGRCVCNRFKYHPASKNRTHQDS